MLSLFNRIHFIRWRMREGKSVEEIYNASSRSQIPTVDMNYSSISFQVIQRILRLYWGLLPCNSYRGVVVYRGKVLVRAKFLSPEMNVAVRHIDEMQGLPQMLWTDALITKIINAFVLATKQTLLNIPIKRRPIQWARTSSHPFLDSISPVRKLDVGAECVPMSQPL